MKQYEFFKIKTKELRRQGRSFGEIQKILNSRIPKSTLSDWCKGIPLPPRYAQRLRKLNYINLRRGRALAIKKAQQEKQHFFDILRDQNKNIWKQIDKQNARLILAALYLGEGKKRDGSLVLGSSDAGIAKLFIKLLNMCYGIGIDTIKCWVAYRADQDLETLINYWSNQTGIPKSNFYKTKADPRTQNKKTLKVDYRGVCVMNVLQSSKIHAEIKVLSEILTTGL